MSFSTRRLTENLSVVKNKMSIFTRRFTLENFANKPNAKRRKTCEKPYDQLVKEHPKYVKNGRYHLFVYRYIE